MTNTQWERMDAGSDVAKALQWGVYTLWSCLRDGEHIFRIERTGITPTAAAGGYFSIASALKTKGIRL